MVKRMFFLVIMLIFVGTIGGYISSYASTTTPDYNSTQTRIVYNCLGNGSDEAGIYVINADGTGKTKIIDRSWTQSCHGWSPDGKKLLLTIANRQDTNLRSAIYTINSDGTGKKRLTNNSDLDYTNPCWSPDGSKIVFLFGQDLYKKDINDEIYVMNSDGTGQRQLTNTGTYKGVPAWSPDAKKIVFVSRNEYEKPKTSSDFRCWNYDIFVVGLDGTNQINLTNTDLVDESRPAWSPNGSKIAYQSSARNLSGSINDRSREDIYVMNSDGTGQVCLTKKGENWVPTWNFDGSKIMFHSVYKDDNDGYKSTNIIIMSPDGSCQVNISSSAGTIENPSWSPDGSKVVFTSLVRGENPKIVSINADGTGEKELTEGTDPIWSPWLK